MSIVQFKKRSGAVKKEVLRANKAKEETTVGNDDSDGSDEISLLVKDKSAPIGNKRSFTQARTISSSSSSSSSLSSSSSASAGEKGDEAPRLSSVTTVYSSTKEVVPIRYAGEDATSTAEIDTAHDRDARAVLEKKKDISSLPPNKLTGTQGPIRAPSFLRATSRFDYKPDICKDYKETGFCGYGDNCIFLHDRGDYKSGWQLEQEWEAKQAKKRKLMADGVQNMLKSTAGGVGGDVEKGEEEGGEGEEDYEIHSDDDEFPFACFICREPFLDPVVTLCGHYFCEQCAIQRVRRKKQTKCAACGKETSGVFNKARKLIKHMQKLGKTGEALRSNSGSAAGGDGDGLGETGDAGVKQPVVSVRKQGQWEEV